MQDTKCALNAVLAEVVSQSLLCGATVHELLKSVVLVAQKKELSHLNQAATDYLEATHELNVESDEWLHESLSKDFAALDDQSADLSPAESPDSLEAQLSQERRELARHEARVGDFQAAQEAAIIAAHAACIRIAQLDGLLSNPREGTEFQHISDAARYSELLRALNGIADLSDSPSKRRSFMRFAIDRVVDRRTVEELSRTDESDPLGGLFEADDDVPF